MSLLPRRKWLVSLHLRNGKRVRFTTSDLGTKTNLNRLTGLEWDKGTALDYVRLNDIVAITSRRSWSSWVWPVWTQIMFYGCFIVSPALLVAVWRLL